MQHPDDLEPRRVGRLWIFPDDTTLPVVSGGDGSDDDSGDDDDDQSDDDSGSDDADDDSDGDDDGDDDGDKPKSDADWKHRARQWERRAKANAKKLEAAEAKNKSAGDKAIDDARKAGASETHSKLAGRLFAAEVRDQAKGKLNVPASLLRDPQVALTMLELDELPVDDDGEVDTDAIADAIEALLKREPDLAAKTDDTGDDDPKGKSKGKTPKAPAGPRGSKPKALEDHSVDDFRKLLKRDR